MAARKGGDGKIRPSEFEGMELGKYDGVAITECAATITGTGDGLSESMHMGPMHMPIGSVGVAIVPFKVVSHEHDPVKVKAGETKDDELTLTHVLKATGAFVIDPDLVDEMVGKHFARVAEHRADVERKKREARGEFGLPLGGEGDNGGEGEDPQE